MASAAPVVFPKNDNRPSKSAQPVGVWLRFTAGERVADRRNYFFLAGLAAFAPSLALVDLGAAVSFLAAAGFLSAISVAPLIAVQLENRSCPALAPTVAAIGCSPLRRGCIVPDQHTLRLGFTLQHFIYRLWKVLSIGNPYDLSCCREYFCPNSIAPERPTQRKSESRLKPDLNTLK